MRILDYSDGIITNWGTHFWDIALWCIDAEQAGPVEIEGHGVWPPSGQLWNVLKRFEVTYRLAGGVPIYYENTRNPQLTGAQGECTAYVKIEGTQGWVYGSYGPHLLRSEPATLVQQPPASWKVQFPLKSDKQDFIDAIKTGGRTMENEDVAHHVTSFCELGHIAIHLGQKLHWDPQRQKFIDNEAANRYLEQPIVGLPGA